MTKGNLINNTKTRRKGSMLQDSLSKIMYLLVLAFLLVIPMRAKAGFDFEPIDQTDTGANRLIYYYDTVGRQTYIQVTNTSDGFVSIHVQVFEAEDNCNEVNFDQCLTPGDTNIYNVEALPGGPNLSESYGIVAISVYPDNHVCHVGETDDSPLIGMFRIIDDLGYEYRTNAANSEDTGYDEGFNVLNFNDVNGNDLSDVVGITYLSLSDSQIFASPLVTATFGDTEFPQNLIFDEFENPNSCSPTYFACDPTHINKGIDNSIPNSQGFPRICNSSKLDEVSSAGWLFLPLVDLCVFENTDFDDCEEGDIYFVGFLGLNNGDGTGSMDSWISASEDLD